MATRTPTVAAYRQTVEALEAGGRIEAVDAALVAVGHKLARMIDDPEEPVVPVTWAMLAVLRELRGVHGDSGDDLGALIAALSAPMGDAPES